jgi:peptide methionine sulfoxide reductase msrA/msrB
MKILRIVIVALGLTIIVFATQQCGKEEKMTYKKLTHEEERVIVHKGTESPFSGRYLDNKEAGIYLCRRCGAQLYCSDDKFESHCGWPSFDDEIPGAIKRIPDADGIRTEIVCTNCSGHLGHVFVGENLTNKNIRHCVNSISLVFIPADKAKTKTMKAYFAGGCFWGVEYWLEKTEGVITVRSGYMGGTVEKPTYEQVCSGQTGHAETVEVEYDPAKVSFEELAKLFFEIHDPTQRDMQGPDIGQQYRSAIFYVDPQQKQTVERLIEQLKKKGFNVVTQLQQAADFWPAEQYHQNYYEKTHKKPYCHVRTKRF